MTKTVYNYELVKSSEYYCLAALLQTIFKTKGVQIDQTEIGRHLGIVLPKNSLELGERDLGISLDIVKFNKYFKLYQLGYIAAYIPASTIFEGELDSILDKYLKLNSHIIACYDYERLYKNIQSEIGHVSIVKEVLHNKISLLDPGPKSYGEFSFSLDDVFEAMRSRNGGLLILNP